MDEDGANDYYLEGDRLVFTGQYHLRRGSCCGSGCRHCPYHPRSTRGVQRVLLTNDLPARSDPAPSQSDSPASPFEAAPNPDES
ncbi:MAG: DUF5522 domain-containing protein [Blastocatellia bacterium]